MLPVIVGCWFCLVLLPVARCCRLFSLHRPGPAPPRPGHWSTTSPSAFCLVCVLPLAAIIFSQPAASSYLLFFLLFASFNFVVVAAAICLCASFWACFDTFFIFYFLFFLLFFFYAVDLLPLLFGCFGKWFCLIFHLRLVCLLKLAHTAYVWCARVYILSSELSPYWWVWVYYVSLCMSYILWWILYGCAVLYYPSAFDLLEFLTGFCHLPFG